MMRCLRARGMWDKGELHRCSEPGAERQVHMYISRRSLALLHYSSRLLTIGLTQVISQSTTTHTYQLPIATLNVHTLLQCPPHSGRLLIALLTNRLGLLHNQLHSPTSGGHLVPPLIVVPGGLNLPCMVLTAEMKTTTAFLLRDALLRTPWSR